MPETEKEKKQYDKNACLVNLGLHLQSAESNARRPSDLYKCAFSLSVHVRPYIDIYESVFDFVCLSKGS